MAQNPKQRIGMKPSPRLVLSPPPLREVTASNGTFPRCSHVGQDPFPEEIWQQGTASQATQGRSALDGLSHGVQGDVAVAHEVGAM